MNHRIGAMSSLVTFGKRDLQAPPTVSAGGGVEDDAMPMAAAPADEVVLRHNRFVLVLQNLAFLGAVYALGIVTHVDWKALPAGLLHGRLPGPELILPGLLLILCEAFTIWQWVQPFVLKLDSRKFQYVTVFGELQEASWDRVRDINRARWGKYRYVRVDLWGGDAISIWGCAGHGLGSIIELMQGFRNRHNPVSVPASNQGFDRKHLYGGH
jgi:hypothetical protein